MLLDPLKRNNKNYFLFFAFLLLIIVTNWSSLRSPLVGDDEYFIHASLDPFFVSYPHFFLYANSPFYFRPLVFMVWSLQYLLFGYSGLASHMINIMFQAGIAYLLYRFLTRLKVSQITALFVSLLFAINPMAVEVLSWSAGRGDCMSVFFILLAMNLYLSYMRNPGKVFLGSFIISAIAALLSKELAYLLLILIPAMQLLFGGAALVESGQDEGARGRGISDDATDDETRKRSAHNASPKWVGVISLYAVFLVLTLIRYVLLGGMGGQYKLYGVPSLEAVSRTMVTLLAPFSDLEVSHGKILLFVAYAGLLMLASFGLVIERWKQAPVHSRRIWIFFLIFFGISFAPVFRRALAIGISNNMEDSRFLYTTTLPLMALLVIGLLEFGSRRRAWRIMAVPAIAVLVPAFMIGTERNSILWNQEALVVDHIAHQTASLLPSPPPDAKLYLDKAPSQVWHYYYGSGLDQAVRLAYGRRDLDIEIVDASPDSPELRDGYLFIYESSTNQLQFIRGPQTG